MGGVRDQAMHWGMRLVGARVARADVVGAVLRGHVDAELRGVGTDEADGGPEMVTRFRSDFSDMHANREVCPLTSPKATTTS